MGRFLLARVGKPIAVTAGEQPPGTVIHPLPTSAGGPSPRVPPLWIRNIPRRAPLGCPLLHERRAPPRAREGRIAELAIRAYRSTRQLMPQAYPSCRQPKQTQCAEAGGEEREHG